MYYFSDMLKFGLIGAGHLGKIHLRLLREIESIDLVGFYDAQQAVRNAVSEEFDIKAFDDLHDLIDAVDAVDIVTPTVSHYEIAKIALKKGKHIFIEKPITKTLEEAESLIDLTYEAGVKAQVGHVERFNPAFVEGKKYIDRPVFIEVHRLAQFNPRGTDVSVVLDLMIHDIDIVLSVVNSPIKKVHASGVAIVSKTPDICNARLEFNNGCVANLTASRLSMKNMRKARFFQQSAYVSIDFLDKKIEVFELEALKENESEMPFDMVIKTAEGQRKRILMNKPTVKPHNAIKEELISFCKTIQENSNSAIPVEQGYAALKIAHAIIEKLKANLEMAES